MNVMRTLLLSLICIPTIVFSQNVLDGIYIREHSPSTKFIRALNPGGDIKMISQRDSIKSKKPIKIEGFEHINTANYLPVYTQNERQQALPALNSYTYTLSVENLIGNQTYGLINPKQDTIIKRSKQFYFKTTEVTNAEYREFVRYVTDSIKRRILAEEEPDKFLNQNLNWNIPIPSFNDDDYGEALSEILLPNSDEYFYMREKVDTRKLNYEYTDKHDYQYVVNIYPDTLSWVHNHYGAFVEPNTQMYFWHPVYDDYPVVGISYNQAKAYLNWLTKKGIEELDKKDLEYELSLPTHEEWEFTSSLLYTFKKQKEPKAPDFYEEFLDKDDFLDLQLKEHSKFNNYPAGEKDSLFLKQSANRIINQQSNSYFKECQNFTIDGEQMTFVSNYANEEFPNMHCANSKVFHLASNVSEWLEAPYKNYKDYFDLKANTLADSKFPEVKSIGKNLKAKCNKFNNNHQMVIGGNWMDEHYDMYFGVPLKGLYTKTFVHPDSSYSTVGFRYLIRLLKDSSEELSIDFKPDTLLNIYEEIKKAGFKTVDSTKNTMTFVHFENKKANENANPNVLDGLYIRERTADQHSYSELKLMYPDLLKSIVKSDGDVVSFYSIIPGEHQNMMAEFSLKVLKRHTIKLTRI